MSKRLIVLLALAFVVGLAFNAYAEVQNIKVSGDVLVSGITRDNFNLLKETAAPSAAAGANNDDQESLFLTQTRVRVDADLTDNVSATVRLINERNWSVQDTVTNNNDDIDLDLAYVSLKEFLYSPLSLKVGRQEIKFGNGLIIGHARNYVAGAAAASSIAGVPTDLTMKKAFDAIRATFNYDALVVDAVYAKMDENTNTPAATAGVNDDVDLFGVNAKFDIDSKTSIEGYAWILDGSDDATVGFTDKASQVITFGGLLTVNPIEKLKASLEVAHQTNKPRVVGNGERRTTSWAFQAMADYTLGTKYDPMLGFSYTHLPTDWQAGYYDQPGIMNNIVYTILPYSNIQAFNIKGSIKPMDDVTLLANYGWYQRNKDTVVAGAAANSNSDGTNYGTYNLRGEKELGSAVDLTATYDYTEDVQFGLTTGMFFPGRAFDGDNDKAVQVVGSMKVTF